MDAKINEAGALLIKRGKEWKVQFCPYSCKFCGDHCPMFQIESSVPSAYPRLIMVCYPGKNQEVIVITEDERK